MKYTKKIALLLLLFCSTLSLFAKDLLTATTKDGKLLFNKKEVEILQRDALVDAEYNEIRTMLSTLIDNSWTPDLNNKKYQIFKEKMLVTFPIRNFDDSDLDAIKASYWLIISALEDKNAELIVSDDLGVKFELKGKQPTKATIKEKSLKNTNPSTAKNTQIATSSNEDTGFGRRILTALVATLLGVGLGAFLYHIFAGKKSEETSSNANDKKLDEQKNILLDNLSKSNTKAEAIQQIERFLMGANGNSSNDKALQLLKNDNSSPKIVNNDNTTAVNALLNQKIDNSIESQIKYIDQLREATGNDFNDLKKNVLNAHLVTQIDNFKFKNKDIQPYNEQLKAFITHTVNNLQQKLGKLPIDESTILFAFNARIQEQIGIETADEKIFWEQANKELDELIYFVENLKDQITAKELAVVNTEFMKWTLRFYDMCKLKTQENNIVPRYKFNYLKLVNQLDNIKSVKGIKPFSEDINQTSQKAIRFKQIAKANNAQHLEDISVLGYYIAPEQLK